MVNRVNRINHILWCLMNWSQPWSVGSPTEAMPHLRWSILVGSGDPCWMPGTMGPMGPMGPMLVKNWWLSLGKPGKTQENDGKTGENPGKIMGKLGQTGENDGNCGKTQENDGKTWENRGKWSENLGKWWEHLGKPRKMMGKLGKT